VSERRGVETELVSPRGSNPQSPDRARIEPGIEPGIEPALNL
jgi:hypothetical protein